MDPITGGSVDTRQPTTPPKTKEEELQKDPPLMENESAVENQTLNSELAKSKTAFDSNRPSHTGQANEGQPDLVNNLSKPVSSLALSAWGFLGSTEPESKLETPKTNDTNQKKENSALHDLLGDVQKGIENKLIDQSSKSIIGLKTDSKDSQNNNLQEKIEAEVRNLLALGNNSDERSIKAIAELMHDLPAANDTDKALLDKTFKDIISLKDYQGDIDIEFLNKAKTALDSSSLPESQRIEAVKKILIGAFPNEDTIGLTNLSKLLSNLPNQTAQEQNIFKKTLGDLSELSSNTKLSNLEKNVETTSSILSAFSHYRQNAASKEEADLNKMKDGQQNFLREYIKSSLSDNTNSDVIASIGAKLLTNIEDNPYTAKNEIKSALDFATSIQNLNFDSADELRAFGKNLVSEFSSAYRHLNETQRIEKIAGLAKEVFTGTDFGKKYGFDKLSDELISNTVKDLYSGLAKTENILEDTELKATILKSANNLIHGLEENKKSELISDLFSNLDSGSATNKAVLGIVENNLRSLSKEEGNNLIDFTTHLLDSDLTLFDSLANSKDVAARLGLDQKLVNDAQNIIAKTGTKVFEEMFAKPGSPVDLSKLSNTLASLTAGDGVFNGDDFQNISTQVANNILDKPQSQEEKATNQKANSQMESQLQAGVRSEAFSTISKELGKGLAKINSEVARGISQRPILSALFPRMVNRIAQNKAAPYRSMAYGMANQANWEASSWFPGKSGGEVSSKMNQGYLDNKPRAESIMRSTVTGEVFKEVAKSFSDFQAQGSINLLSDMFERAGYPKAVKAEGLRVDDLRNLQALKGATSNLSLDGIGTRGLDQLGLKPDINKLLGVDPDIKFQRTAFDEKLGRFDIFSDKNTNQEFYRLTNKNGDVRYAIKDNEDKYKYLADGDMSYQGRSYASVIDSFEAIAKAKPEAVVKADEGNYQKFKDPLSGDEFYKFTGKDGKSFYAVKSDLADKTGWAKIESGKLGSKNYQHIIDSFEGKLPAITNLNHPGALNNLLADKASSIISPSKDYKPAPINPNQPSTNYNSQSRNSSSNFSNTTSNQQNSYNQNRSFQSSNNHTVRRQRNQGYNIKPTYYGNRRHN